MAYSLEWCKDQDILSKMFSNVDIDVRLNYPPMQLAEIDARKAAEILTREVPALIEHRTIFYGFDKITFVGAASSFLNCTVYYFSNFSCVILAYDVKANEARWFYGGCQHSYKELTQAECRKLNIPHFGMCYHVAVCSKCNHKDVWDSSD